MKLLQILTLCALAALPACAQTTNAPRSRSGGNITDTNALSFIARAGITTAPEKARINRLVLDLKAANIWTNLSALYPFAGTTSNSCAQNLISTNFAIIWNGTNTFSGRGVIGDGQSGYGNTQFNPRSQNVNTNSFHEFVWYADGAVPKNAPLLWAQDSSSGNQARIDLDQPGATISMHGIFTSGSGFSEPDLQGNILLQRINATTVQYCVDGDVEPVSLAVQNSPTNNILLLSDSSTIFSSANIRAASFGSALTLTQVTNYFRIMNSYSKFVVLPSSNSSSPTTNAPIHRN